jgi:hypothetical protein
MKTWYEAKTGNHQGLVVEETTGRDVAVAYDKADAALIAAAPELLAALETIANSGLVNYGPDARFLASIAAAAISKAKP